jgi:hypothetical protein
VMALPPSQREALTLREYEGLSYAEIAKTLGISRAAAEMLVYRARRSFRAAYEGTAASTVRDGCTTLAPLMSRMLDDEVSIATRGALMAHLEACARCRADVKALGRTRGLPAVVPA